MKLNVILFLEIQTCKIYLNISYIYLLYIRSQDDSFLAFLHFIILLSE